MRERERWGEEEEGERKMEKKRRRGRERWREEEEEEGKREKRIVELYTH